MNRRNLLLAGGALVLAGLVALGKIAPEQVQPALEWFAGLLG